jgi:hypothetical protein
MNEAKPKRSKKQEDEAFRRNPRLKERWEGGTQGLSEFDETNRGGILGIVQYRLGT